MMSPGNLFILESNGQRVVSQKNASVGLCTLVSCECWLLLVSVVYSLITTNNYIILITGS